MHQLARLGIILLGLYAITNGFIAASGIITETITTVPTSQIMVAIVTSIVIGFVPGVLLIAVNRKIATAIFSSGEVGSLKLNDVQGLHSLLGVYFLIYGLFGTLFAFVPLLGHLLGLSDVPTVPLLSNLVGPSRVPSAEHRRTKFIPGGEAARAHFLSRPGLNPNPLDLLQGGGDRLRILDRPAIFEIRRDAGRPEGMVAAGVGEVPHFWPEGEPLLFSRWKTKRSKPMPKKGKATRPQKESQSNPALDERLNQQSDLPSIEKVVLGQYACVNHFRHAPTQSGHREGED